MLAEVGRLGCEYLGSKGSNRSQHRGGRIPRAFQTESEFLVQNTEEVGDGEIESSCYRHSGGYCTRVWLVAGELVKLQASNCSLSS